MFFFVRFRFTIRFGRVSYIVPLFLPNDTMPNEAQMDRNCILAHFKTIVDIAVAIRFGPVFDMWLREVLANERIHHMCNFDCMRPCSVIQHKKKQTMFSVKKGCNKLLCGEIFIISSCTCLEKVVIYTIVRAVNNQRTEHVAPTTYVSSRHRSNYDRPFNDFIISHNIMLLDVIYVILV